MSTLDGRVALVTGAAGRIGSVTAEHLAAAGARVVLADLPGAGQEHIAQQLSADGRSACAVPLDLRDETSVQKAVQAAVDTFGRLDIVDNNAVASHLMEADTDLTEARAEVWTETLAVNLRGPMLVCKHALPHLAATGRGVVVNVSSALSKVGTTGQPAYAASKAALNQLTRSVAATYGRAGVRANAIAPGPVVATRRAGLDDAAVGAAMLRRPCTPDDVADVIVFLASDAASYLTAQVISLDGGLTTQLKMP